MLTVANTLLLILLLFSLKLSSTGEKSCSHPGKSPVSPLLFHNSGPVNGDMLSLTGRWVCRYHGDFADILLYSHRVKKRGVTTINSLFMKCVKHLAHLFHGHVLPIFRRGQKTTKYKILCVDRVSVCMLGLTFIKQCEVMFNKTQSS